MACELCGYEKVTVVHHRNRNPLNNSSENLQVLCMNCHHLQHHPKGCDGHKKREMLIISYKISHGRYFPNFHKKREIVGKLAWLTYNTRTAGPAQQKRLNDDMIYNLAKLFILNEMPDYFIAQPPY